MREEIQIRFFQSLQLGRDADIDGQLTHGVDSGLAIFFLLISSTPFTPIALAISRYFVPVHSALYSITIGSIIAQATPCGVS